MLAQCIREKGVKQRVWQCERELLGVLIADKYCAPYEKLRPILDQLSREMILELGKRILYWDSYDQVQDWIQRQTDHAK